jgi:RNA polymerase sigma-70 factor (ECF subfamily)
MPAESENPSEFVALLTEAQSALYGCIHAMMAGSADATDVLQETNRVLWEKRAEYDPSRPFLPWAYAVARFEVLAQRKRRQRDRLVFDGELLDRIAGEYAEQCHDGDLKALEKCLQKLPPEQRDMLRARYAGDESVNAIAARLGKAGNAVSALLYRLRGILADCITRELAHEH